MIARAAIGNAKTKPKRTFKLFAGTDLQWFVNSPLAIIPSWTATLLSKGRSAGMMQSDRGHLHMLRLHVDVVIETARLVTVRTVQLRCSQSEKKVQ